MEVTMKTALETIRRTHPTIAFEKCRSVIGQLGGWITSLILAFKTVRFEIDPRIDFPRDF